MRKAASTLTPQELAIMKVVWTRDTVTVRDVYEVLRQKRRKNTAATRKPSVMAPDMNSIIRPPR